MRSNRNQVGFTLVELSIVLVIIGLIISSVLVGQDLIRSAEIRSTVTQFENFNSAIGTFRARYTGIPGDISGETDYSFDGNTNCVAPTFGGAPSTCDGNSDGVLTDGTGFTNFNNADVRNTHDGELVYFWSHLGSSGAEFINGSFDGSGVNNSATQLNSNIPQAKSGGSWGVYSKDGVNYYIIGVTVSGAADTTYTTSNSLTPIDSRDMDTKIDDGNPIRGIVQAKGENAGDPDTDPSYDQNGDAAGCVRGSAASYVAAVTANSAEYNTSGDTSNACTLRLRISI